MTNLQSFQLSLEEIEGLIRRCELMPSIFRRQQEELITSIVSLSSELLDEHRSLFLEEQDLNEVLEEHHWTESDLELHIARLAALQIFSEAKWGPSLEETFLASQGNHDQVIYSILRVEDTCLARELWIRLEEGEATFAEVASTFGEGPEALRKGLIGPMEMCNVSPPSLQALLRTLQQGEIHPPLKVTDGKKDWNLLIRLESIKPARFDKNMRKALLGSLLDDFLSDRVNRLMNGETLEEIDYDEDQ